MGRLPRVIAVGVAHHVTQRGNGRRFRLEEFGCQEDVKKLVFGVLGGLSRSKRYYFFQHLYSHVH
jgi:hypothetical protein